MWTIGAGRHGLALASDVRVGKGRGGLIGEDEHLVLELV